MLRETEQWIAFIKNQLDKEGIKKRLDEPSIHNAGFLLSKINRIIADLEEPIVSTYNYYPKLTWKDRKWDVTKNGYPRNLLTIVVVGKSVKIIRNNVSEAMAYKLPYHGGEKRDYEKFTESVLNIETWDILKNKGIALLYYYNTDKMLPDIKVYEYEENRTMTKSAEQSFQAITNFEMATEGVIKKIKNSLPNCNIPAPKITDKPNKRVLKWRIDKNQLRIQIKLRGIVVSLSMDGKNYKGSGVSVINLVTKPIWEEVLGFFEEDKENKKEMKLLKPYPVEEDESLNKNEGYKKLEDVAGYLNKEYGLCKPSRIRRCWKGKSENDCIAVWKWDKERYDILRITEKNVVYLYPNQKNAAVKSAGIKFNSIEEFYNSEELVDWISRNEGKVSKEIRRRRIIIEENRGETIMSKNKKVVTSNENMKFDEKVEDTQPVGLESGFSQGYFECTLEVLKELYKDSSTDKESFIKIMKEREIKLRGMGRNCSLVRYL